MTKIDRKWAEDFFRRCLKAVGCGHWTFELCIERLEADDGATCGDAEADPAGRHAKIHLYTRIHDSKRTIEGTLAHEAVEVALSPLAQYLKSALVEAGADYAWKLAHEAINELEKVVAKVARSG